MHDDRVRPNCHVKVSGMGYLTMSQREALRPGLVRVAEKGKVTNAEGAASLGVTVRQFRRLRAAYRQSHPRA